MDNNEKSHLGALLKVCYKSSTDEDTKKVLVGAFKSLQKSGGPDKAYKGVLLELSKKCLEGLEAVNSSLRAEDVPAKVRTGLLKTTFASIIAKLENTDNVAK